MESNDFKILKDGKELASSENKELTVEERVKKIFESAFEKLEKDNYSNIFKDNNSSFGTTLSMDTVNSLSTSPQDDLRKVLDIATYARAFINKNDLIGKTYDAIENNTNTKMTLSFSNFESSRNKNVKVEKAKNILQSFNKQVNSKKLIRQAIPAVYAEGNYVVYLRGNSKVGYNIDYYPLGLCVVSDYTIKGQPVILMDISELKQMVRPDSNTKDLFFKDIDEVIQNNFPEEVVEAYNSKSKYAMLNPERTGIIRVNNLGRKYGVSSILRAFEPLITLEEYNKSDALNSKAKAKKIIWQKLGSELYTNDAEGDMMGKASYAHQQLTDAWGNPTVVYTSMPWVDNLSYVEPSTTSTSVDILNYQRNKIFTALGITFLNETGVSVTGGKISVSELMKSINKISEQLEDIFEKYYRLVLIDNGYSENDVDNYCPTVEIIDSEQMEWDVKKDVATLLYTVLNCSLETTLDVLGYSAKDEAEKRKQENDNGYADIFAPRQTSYTSNNDSTNNTSGRPAAKNSNDPEKQAVDKQNRN